jgi:glycosyltransferase involved in cell wall biosynthesis
MYSNLKIAVIIPAYNEETSIGKVIRDIPEGIADDIIVVDNGCTDDTAAVARRCGATVITEPRRGYGAACIKGISVLDKCGPDAVVFLDADYSDYPGQITRLLDPVADDKADFVLGSRVLGNREQNALLPQVYWGNKTAVFLIRMLFGFKYTDMGPFRAIRYNSLMRLGMKDRDFGWNAEMQVKALQELLWIKEVPVDYRKRIGTSKISGTISGTLGAGTKIIYTILKYRFKMFHGGKEN